MNPIDNSSNPANFTQSNLNSSMNQLIFVDSNVPDHSYLCEKLPANTEVIILNPERNGIEEITEILEKRTKTDTIHVISHGKPGTLLLGNTELNAHNLENYASKIREWGTAFTDKANLLLYGCQVAAGTIGEAFVKELSQLIKVNIAASETLTGNEGLGGNWNLEFTTGKITADLLFNNTNCGDYAHVLELIEGDAGDNTINGGAEDDTINGGAGNDTISGGDGNDTIDGGAGDDVINGSDGDDSINGGDDNDTINGDGGSDTIDGGAGDDSIIGSDGDDLINGGEGNDTISGGAGLDTIDGGGGNDVINGSDGSDEIYGGDGNDYINGGGGSDTIYGGAGDDFLTGVETAAASENDYDVFYGQGGADTFAAGENGTLYYTEGYHKDKAIIKDFDASEGDKIQLVGDASEYTIVSGTNIMGNSFTEIYYNDGTQNGDAIFLIEGVALTDLTDETIFIYDTPADGGLAPTDDGGLSPADDGEFPADEITTTEDQTLTGTPDVSDTLTGGAGNDTITGSSGDHDPTIAEEDILTGGAGADKFVLGDETGVFYDAQDRADCAIIKDFNATEGDQIQLAGSPEDYTIVSGTNALGNDYTEISQNGDLIAVIEGVQLTDLSDLDIFCYVEIPGGEITPADDQTLTGTPDVSDTLTGDTGNDTITGSSGDHDPTIAEEDILTGGAGADKFVLGDETGVFYDAQDRADCAIIKDFNATEGDQIQLAGAPEDYTIVSGTNALGNDYTEISQNGDLIAVIEGVQLTDLSDLDIFCYVEIPGGEITPADDQTLTGTPDVSDTLTGDTGNDTITGSSGDHDPTIAEEDILTGGAGADKFVLGDETGVFYDAQDRADCAIIKDFNATEGDQIQLAGAPEDYTIVSGTNALGNDYTEISQNGDLIAVIEGVQLTDLSDLDIFCYVEIPGGEITPADDQTLTGTENSDTLTGGDGNDTLIGSSSDTPQGNSEEDILTGGAGADLFVLGDETGVFYNKNQRLDCAIIQDFNAAEGDLIQLAGTSGDYTLEFGSNALGNDYTEISQNGDLIALVEGVQLTDLTSSNFSYV
jgi:Ca2+-binding RTX toxin-like protein